jgi:uncharacterized membrane protein
MRLRSLLPALALACALRSLSPGILSAQATGSMFNQRDDQYRVLGLKRAKEVYEASQKEYDRQKMLFGKGLISQAELDRSRASFADAEVNYQQSLLAVLFEQQYVTVVNAVKYQGKDGAKRVRLQLANASGGSAEFRKLINLDDELFRSLQPDIINDVYVSLLNNESAVIGKPYESKIDHLKFGDLDIVTVNIIYGKGTQRTLKVFLEKDVSVNKVLVQSTQFSQEVELGKTASYDLTLELFGGIGTTFNLEVANLPAQVNHAFKDPAGGARLSQFKFTETTNSRKAALDISLPDRPTEAIPMDRPIRFYVLVIPSDRMGEFKDLQRREWKEEELEKLKVGYVKLELVARGTGRLLVRAEQLYFAINPSGAVDMTVELVNEGSRRIDDVEVNADLPLNWSKTIEPAVVNALEIGEEHKVHLHFTPPAGIGVGRYDIRLRTSGLTDTQPVTGEDKTITVEVQAQANVFGTALLVIVILGLVAGMVVFGIRLSRK